MARRDSEPQYYTSKTNTKVRNYNVYIMQPKERIMYSIIVAICGGAVGLIFYGGLFKRDGISTMATMISNIVVFVVGPVRLCRRLKTAPHFYGHSCSTART